MGIHSASHPPPPVHTFHPPVHTLPAPVHTLPAPANQVHPQGCDKREGTSVRVERGAAFSLALATSARHHCFQVVFFLSVFLPIFPFLCELILRWRDRHAFFGSPEEDISDSEISCENGCNVSE